VRKYECAIESKPACATPASSCCARCRAAAAGWWGAGGRALRYTAFQKHDATGRSRRQAEAGSACTPSGRCTAALVMWSTTSYLRESCRHSKRARDGCAAGGAGRRAFANRPQLIILQQSVVSQCCCQDMVAGKGRWCLWRTVECGRTVLKKHAAVLIGGDVGCGGRMNLFITPTGNTACGVYCIVT